MFVSREQQACVMEIKKSVYFYLCTSLIVKWMQMFKIYVFDYPTVGLSGVVLISTG